MYVRQGTTKHNCREGGKPHTGITRERLLNDNSVIYRQPPPTPTAAAVSARAGPLLPHLDALGVENRDGDVSGGGADVQAESSRLEERVHVPLQLEVHQILRAVVALVPAQHAPIIAQSTSPIERGESKRGQAASRWGWAVGRSGGSLSLTHAKSLR